MRIIFLLFLSISAFSQNYFTLKGSVFNLQKEPLSNASIRVLNLNTGTTSKEDGSFSIRLIEGNNKLAVSSVGYKTESFEIIMTTDKSQNVVLAFDQKQMEELTVKAKRRDPAYEIMQQVVENKGRYLNQSQNFNCQTYIKSFEDHILKSKAKKDSIVTKSWFEANLTRTQDNAGHLKEVKEAVKTWGEQRSLFFRSASDGEFNLYKNTQSIPKLGQNVYSSPLHDLYLLSYKFKLLLSYYEQDQKIYRIKVEPREIGNALYEGEIEVYDGSWAIKKVDLDLSPRGLLLYDAFKIEQYYELLDGKSIISKTTYHWTLKEGKEKKRGRTSVLNTNFKFDQPLPRKFFGNEVGTILTDAYEKDSLYWNTNRKESLLSVEKQTLKDRELLEIKQNSKAYLDSVDKEYNKITFTRVLFGGVNHTNRFMKTNWSFSPLIAIVNPFIVGGIRVGYGISRFKKYESKKTLDINFYPNYGILNKDVRGLINGRFLYNPVKRSSISYFLGSGFNAINGFATIADVAKRNNFYQNKFIFISHRTELFNGFYTTFGTRVEERRDISNLKFSKFGDDLFEKNVISPFARSVLTRNTLNLEYTPRQLYLREPKEKIILGSKFPTFFAELEFARPLKKEMLGKYSYVSLGARQTFNIGVTGTSEYRINIGKFTDTSSLAPMDYRYIRGGDTRFFSPNLISFQWIPQTFAVFDWYFEGHYNHQFNGFLTSKIPLFNRTGIKETVGGGLLWVPERNLHYTEAFAGLNRIAKIGRIRLRLGAYYVVSQSNQHGFKSGFKFSVESYNPYKNTWSF